MKKMDKELELRTLSKSETKEMKCQTDTTAEQRGTDIGEAVTTFKESQKVKHYNWPEKMCIVNKWKM